SSPTTPPRTGVSAARSSAAGTWTMPGRRTGTGSRSPPGRATSRRRRRSRSSSGGSTGRWTSMDDAGARERAERSFVEAYEAQMRGDLDAAIAGYQKSIECVPTAEAHTFLGWTYSFKGDYAAAIRECQTAIRIDPDFGNPYNDIGSYLIKLGRYD